MNQNNKFVKKHKYVYNFFLTPEEKDLIFTLKHLHRLSNRVGNDSEKYSDFINKMSEYYKNILEEFNS